MGTDAGGTNFTDADVTSPYPNLIPVPTVTATGDTDSLVDSSTRARGALREGGGSEAMDAAVAVETVAAAGGGIRNDACCRCCC